MDLIERLSKSTTSDSAVHQTSQCDFNETVHLENGAGLPTNLSFPNLFEDEKGGAVGSRGPGRVGAHGGTT